MKKKVLIDQLGSYVLTDKQYVASGGQASVYQVADMALKIYHNPKDMLPIGKIQELSKITSVNVYKPLNVIYDEKKSELIGYSMKFSHDSFPICKLFTKTFKSQHKISPSDIVELVKNIQSTVIEIHKSKCLIVDMNELNLLTDNTYMNPIFIDVDSYQTPSYKATAIMDSIRDRTVKNNQWTELSDWFSFAILAFQLYIGIHPYKGKHPSYKANEWLKRMEDGVSVFDKNVTLPNVCEPLSNIPSRHLDWFKSVFLKGNREIPPLLDNTLFNISHTLQQLQIIQSNAQFLVSLYCEVDKDIVDFYNIFGIKYSLTTEGNIQYLYKESGLMKTLPAGINSFTYTNQYIPILCTLDNCKNLTFKDLQDNSILNIKSVGYYVAGNTVFSFNDNLLTEISFSTISNKIIYNLKTYNVSYASRLYEGCLIQDLLGSIYLTFVSGLYFVNKHIKELDGYRILECKKCNNFVVLITEKSGVYDRFVIHLDISNTFNIKYTIRKTENVSYNIINFTVLDNGLAILQTDDDIIEIFKDNVKVKIIDNIPFDYSMKLFSIQNDVFFINKNQIFNVKIK